MKQEQQSLILRLFSDWLDEYFGEPPASNPISDAETSNVDEARWLALRQLMQSARQLADAGRAAVSDGVAEPEREGLRPIFDQLELEGGHQLPARHFRHRALTTTASEELPLFPVPGHQVSAEEATTHYEQFKARWQPLRNRIGQDDFDVVFTHLLHLTQSYGWCLPANPRAATDVSLYDQMRVTAAIAACLYQHHQVRGNLTAEAVASPGQTRCLLLTGGMSGIQDYIYDITSIGAGGVSKRLRARSFYVQLLSEAASLSILRRFKLPLANLLLASGGKFYVLLPNTPRAEARLKKLQNKFDQWLLKEVHGTLAVKMAWTEIADAEFASGSFGDALTRLHTKMNQSMTRWFAGALQNDSGWVKDNFQGKAFEGDKDCQCCHRFPAHWHQEHPRKPGTDICDQCADQLKLGGRLTRGEFVSFFAGHEPQQRDRIRCFGLSASVDATPRRGAFFVVRLNNPDLSRAEHLPAAFRYLANYVPREIKSRRTLTFEEIAAQRPLAEGERATGLLGVLKADVDYLGLLVQEGLRRDPPARGLDSLTRLATLSRQLDWFFTGWLEWLISHKYPHCYTVYSGGDDLLIIGSRTQALNLAREVREAFTAYTSNPEITLSAGLAVVKPRLPLAHTVEQADKALTKAKDGGRDSLCVLSDVVKWDALPVVIDETVKLGSRIRTSSFLYHLLSAAKLWQQFQKKDLRGLRYHPRLAYQIARNIDPDRESDLHEWAVRLLEISLRDEGRPLWQHLRLITQWVLLGKRERKHDDTR